MTWGGLRGQFRPRRFCGGLVNDWRVAQRNADLSGAAYVATPPPTSRNPQSQPQGNECRTSPPPHTRPIFYFFLCSPCDLATHHQTSQTMNGRAARNHRRKVRKKNLGARGRIYQPVGVGNAPDAKTPTSQHGNLVARGPERFVSGLRQERGSGRAWLKAPHRTLAS